MKKLLLAALAVGSMALGAPAAQASHTYEGGCGFDSVTDPSGQVAQPDVFTGVMYAAVVATNPPGADVHVRCEIRVNNLVKDSFEASGPGVAVGADEAQFLATDADVVTMCDVVTIGGHTSTVCGQADRFQIPPQEVIDLIDMLFIDIIDPAICPVLAGLAPGVPGVVDINTQGDVFVLGDGFFDCPPYGDVFPPA